VASFVVGLQHFPRQIERAYIIIRLEIQYGSDCSLLPQSVDVVGASGMGAQEEFGKNLSVVHTTLREQGLQFLFQRVTWRVALVCPRSLSTASIALAPGGGGQLDLEALRFELVVLHYREPVMCPGTD